MKWIFKFIYLLNFSLPQVCWLFSSCGEGSSRGFSLQSAGLWVHRLGTWGARALLPHGTWDLPAPEPEPMSPALAGGFWSTEPPRQSLDVILETPPVTETFATFTLLQPWAFSSKPSVESTLVCCGHHTGACSALQGPLLCWSAHPINYSWDAIPHAFSAFSFIRIVAHTLGPSYSPKLGVQRQICFFLVTFSFHKKFLIAWFLVSIIPSDGWACFSDQSLSAS